MTEGGSQIFWGQMNWEQIKVFLLGRQMTVEKGKSDGDKRTITVNIIKIYLNFELKIITELSLISMYILFLLLYSKVFRDLRKS